MFGMGITEILLIAIVAIIALGPEKLPDAMVQIAKFINKFKNSWPRNTKSNRPRTFSSTWKIRNDCFRKYR